MLLVSSDNCLLKILRIVVSDCQFSVVLFLFMRSYKLPSDILRQTHSAPHSSTANQDFVTTNYKTDNVILIFQFTTYWNPPLESSAIQVDLFFDSQPFKCWLCKWHIETFLLFFWTWDWDRHHLISRALPLLSFTMLKSTISTITIIISNSYVSCLFRRWLVSIMNLME